MPTCCPTCGRKMTAPKSLTLPERADIERAYQAREITSKDDYFAQCKRIGLRDDLRFFIRVTEGTLDNALRIEAMALLAQLETRASKPADARVINSLRDRYRMTKGSLIPRARASRALAVA